MNVSITLPQQWSDLSDREAETVISILFLASGLSRDEAILICALRISGIRIIRADRDGALIRIPRQYGVSRKNIITEMPYERLRFLISEMKWILDMPRYPWRPNKLLGAYPTRADLQDISFGSFLEADALYQGFISQKDPGMIDSLASILIPKRNRRCPVDWERQAILIWFASAKIRLADKFPDLFKKASADGQGALANAAVSIQKNFDAQLRALTKGDPLKEDAVLGLPLYRALTELNAQAAEYAEFKSRMKK